MSEILRKIQAAREAWALGEALHGRSRLPGRINERQAPEPRQVGRAPWVPRTPHPETEAAES